MKNEPERHSLMRRSLTTGASTLGEKLCNFKLGDFSLLSYAFSFVGIFLRLPDSTGALSHHQDSPIQDTFTDPVRFAPQWWTKYRARRRLRFNAKSVHNVIANGVTPITVDSATIITAISSGVDWRGTGWSICSGISAYILYTLFFSLLLLRWPPLL